MTSSTGHMPASPKPTTLWYMPGICKCALQFNLAISTAKNLKYRGHTPWYKNQQIPTSPPNPGVHLAHHHKWPNVNTDGKFLQMGHWLVYAWYLRYTTGTSAKKCKWLSMTVLVCARYLRYTRHIPDRSVTNSVRWVKGKAVRKWSDVNQTYLARWCCNKELFCSQGTVDLSINIHFHRLSGFDKFIPQMLQLRNTALVSC